MPVDTVEEPDDLSPQALAASGEFPAGPGLVLGFSISRPYLLPIALTGGRVELGRDALEEHRVQDDRVSRRHVIVERSTDGDELRVCDLGSTNGVFLNGERLPPHAAKVAPPGSVLRIGRTLFLLVANLAPYQEALRRPLVKDGIVIGPHLYAAHKQVAALAENGHSLFLRGESGCGKEVAARLFHKSSPRRDGPLVAINCAAIPKELAERLLFGAVRGAYSGAVTDSQGYLQAASGGTLFLDEIADLDLSIQAKLLRVLETREVVQLGGTRAHAINLGICVATLRDLREAVAAGTFREDLYYRIGRPEVFLPPLRERLEEIPYLVCQTVEQVGRSASAPLVEACLLRPWPGNVRELRTELHAAAVLAFAQESDAVLPKHLLSQAGQRIETKSENPSENLPQTSTEKTSEKQIEKQIERPAERTITQPITPPTSPPATSTPRRQDELMRTACEALGIAARTVRKLLTSEDFLRIEAELEQHPREGEDLVTFLRERVADALFTLLAARDFNQREVAAELDTSRTTLIKLMGDLGLPRATELDADQIERALAQSGRDVEAAARLLRVSAHGLKKRITELQR